MKTNKALLASLCALGLLSLSGVSQAAGWCESGLSLIHI